MYLKASKTDPFRVGVNIYVGSTGNTLCPVTAVLHYMVARGQGNGPFFRIEDGAPLTRMKFVDKVKEALSQAGVDCTTYLGHSFRIGAATTVLLNGESVTPPSRCWVGGKVAPIRSTSRPHGNSWHPTPAA